MTAFGSGYSFNAWDDPWIDVIDHTGHLHTVSLATALMDAHTFRAIVNTSPLVVYGTHRLLTAILQFLIQPTHVDDIVQGLEAGHLDPHLLDVFAQRYRSRLDLFHREHPFLQTGDVGVDAESYAVQKKAKKVTTVGYLYADIPTATNRTLVHHVRDEDHALCSACCLQGLVCIPAFAQSGGSGWRPSINGSPPLYLIPGGKSLFTSLILSVISPTYQPKVADPARNEVTPWTNNSIIPQNDVRIAVGYIEGLLFPARRVRFFPDAGAGMCTRCGREASIRVAEMLWDYGAYRPTDAEMWKDPFVAYEVGKKAPRAVSVRQGKALWREYGTLFLQRDELAPSVVKQTEYIIEEEGNLPALAHLSFRCLGMRTDKAKVCEWIDEEFDVPPALLVDHARAAVIDEAIDRTTKIATAMQRGFSTLQYALSEQRRSTTLGALRSRMEDTLWAELFPAFWNLIHDVAVTSAYPPLQNAWAQECLSRGTVLFQTTIESVGGHKHIFEIQARAVAVYMKLRNTYRKEWMINDTAAAAS